MRRFFAQPFITLTAATVVLSVLASRSAVLGAASSQEGCMDQWLFNGLWRVEVTKVEPYVNGGQQTGWQVTEVWRNGTTQELAPGDSLMQPQKLTLGNGSIAASASTTGAMSSSLIAG
jgi:hypothetical protein